MALLLKVEMFNTSTINATLDPGCSAILLLMIRQIRLTALAAETTPNSNTPRPTSNSQENFATLIAHFLSVVSVTENV